MKFNKELKRVTFFPAVVKELNESELMDYIVPFVELKYMPSVNKGTSIKLQNNGELIVSDAWSVVFKNQENGIAVSVGNERIDIVSDGNHILQWPEFIAEVDRIFPILFPQQKDGVNRIAVGLLGEVNMNSETVKQFFERLSSSVNFKPMLEWSMRQIERCSLSVESTEHPLDFNDGVTLSVIDKNSGKFLFKIDVDINTVIGADKDLVNSCKTDFIKMAVGRISEESEKYTGLLAFE